MNPTLSCISCGNELPVDYRPGSGFCPHCGVSLVQATPIPTPVPPRRDGTPVAPPVRRGPPAPPRRSPRTQAAPEEDYLFSAPAQGVSADSREVAGSQGVSAGGNPFLTPDSLDERTPPIPMVADGVVSSVRPDVIAAQQYAGGGAAGASASGVSSGAAAHPAPPRPPSPREQSHPEPSTASAPLGYPAPQQGTPVHRSTDHAVALTRGETGPGMGDAHAEFRKGSWKGIAVAVVAVAALVGLFFFMPQQEERVPERATVESKAVIGTSNSPEIIEEPKKDFSKKSAAPTAASASAPSTARQDEGDFAAQFKSKAQ